VLDPIQPEFGYTVDAGSPSTQTNHKSPLVLKNSVARFWLLTCLSMLGLNEPRTNSVNSCAVMHNFCCPVSGIDHPAVIVD